MQTYTVVRGDTLSGIAKKYNVTLNTILKANPKIINPNLIHVGQKITIPVPPTQTPTQVSVVSPPKAPTSLVDIYNVVPTFKQGKSPAGTAQIKGMFDSVAFSFNPEELVDSKGNVYDFTDPSNHAYPILHHKTGKTPTLRFDLYVNDREEEGAVARLINKLNGHIPSETAKAFNAKPPRPMIFSFGKFYVKKVWLEDFTVRRTQFNQELKTQEATISVSLIIDTEG